MNLWLLRFWSIWNLRQSLVLCCCFLPTRRDVSVSLALFIYLSSSLVSIKYFYYFSRSSTSQQLMRLTRIKKINTRVAILMSMSCFAQVFFFFSFLKSLLYSCMYTSLVNLIFIIWLNCSLLGSGVDRRGKEYFEFQNSTGDVNAVDFGYVKFAQNPNTIIEYVVLKVNICFPISVNFFFL